MKIIYIDLDGVVADFDKGRITHPLSTITPYIGRPDRLPGIYENLEPIKNAIQSVTKLLQHESFDVYFLSTPPWDNPEAWTHKRLWIEKYFGKAVRHRLILTARKDLNIGDFLIDDSKYRGQQKFVGEWLEFGSDKFPDWSSVLKYLGTN
jgi:5'-nucleotidase